MHCITIIWFLKVYNRAAPRTKLRSIFFNRRALSILPHGIQQWAQFQHLPITSKKPKPALPSESQPQPYSLLCVLLLFCFSETEMLIVFAPHLCQSGFLFFTLTIIALCLGKRGCLKISLIYISWWQAISVYQNHLGNVSKIYISKPNNGSEVGKSMEFCCCLSKK